jgi:hypothetical protein
VVVRPHPSDSWNAWHRATVDLPNVWVDTTFDLAAWTRAAIAIVHPGTSTAAFEAVCAGVPAIATGSNPTSNAATRLSHRTSSIDEFVLLLAAAERGELPTFPGAGARTVLERKLIHPLGGATERIADILDASAPVEGASALPAQPSGEARTSFLKILRERRQAPPTPAIGQALNPPFKRDTIALEKVERDVESACKILGRSSAISIRPWGANCFLLSQT